MEDEAHWALLGEGIIALMRRPTWRVNALPPGLKRMPGPMIILGEQFIDSPVGPFLSLAIGEPVRLGLRPGYYFGVSVLNSQKARRLGRQRWGFPHELGTLHWSSEPGMRSIEWDERGLRCVAHSFGRPLPLLLWLRALQQRGDGPVIAPSRLRAMARRSQIELTFPENDPLAALSGRHRGLALSGMLIRRSPARRALGLVSTFRAPIRAPEPGVANFGHGSGSAPQ